MNKYLISFGSNGYQNTLNDLKTSAVLFFNDIFIYGENDIKLYRDPTQWRENHKNLFTNLNYEV